MNIVLWICILIGAAVLLVGGLAYVGWRLDKRDGAPSESPRRITPPSGRSVSEEARRNVDAEGLWGNGPFV